MKSLSAQLGREGRLQGGRELIERTIWKYDIPVPVVSEFTLLLPTGAKILHIGVQYDAPRMWALVDPVEELIDYHFIVVGTGSSIPWGPLLSYEGTFQMYGGGLVCHVFGVGHHPPMLSSK